MPLLFWWSVDHLLYRAFHNFKCLENTKKIFGKNLKAIIKRRGYSTIELFAHENRFDKSWVYRIARGERDLLFSAVVRLARALEVELTEFYPMKKRRK